MPKPVLGRTLGALLENHGATPSSGALDAEPSSQLGVGVRSLMRGSHAQAEEQKNETDQSQVVATQQREAQVGKPEAQLVKLVIPAWYCFAGDVLLVAMAWIIASTGARPVTWYKAGFCVLAIGLGACLGLYGILGSPSRKDPTDQNRSKP